MTFVLTDDENKVAKCGSIDFTKFTDATKGWSNIQPSEDDEFAFNYNPLNNHQSTLSYQKNINGFNYSINHNQIFDNSLKHDTNIEVSSKF